MFSVFHSDLWVWLSVHFKKTTCPQSNGFLDVSQLELQTTASDNVIYYTVGISENLLSNRDDMGLRQKLNDRRGMDRRDDREEGWDQKVGKQDIEHLGWGHNTLMMLALREKTNITLAKFFFFFTKKLQKKLKIKHLKNTHSCPTHTYCVFWNSEDQFTFLMDLHSSPLKKK